MERFWAHANILMWCCVAGQNPAGQHMIESSRNKQDRDISQLHMMQTHTTQHNATTSNLRQENATQCSNKNQQTTAKCRKLQRNTFQHTKAKKRIQPRRTINAPPCWIKDTSLKTGVLEKIYKNKCPQTACDEGHREA